MVMLLILHFNEYLWLLHAIYVMILTGSSFYLNIFFVNLSSQNLFSIHPRFKHDVGYRLTQGARAVAYGDSTVEYMGPIVRQVTQSPATKTVNVTYGTASSIDVRNTNGFEV